MKRYFLILIFNFIFLGNSLSQDSFVLHSFHDILPQAGLENPSFIPREKIYIGIPILSQGQVSYSNRFSLNDIVKRDADDSLFIDLDGLLSELKEKNRISVGVKTSLFYAGIKIEDGFLSISGEVVNDVKFTYSSELINVFVKGNGDESFLGRKIRLDNIDFNGLSYYRLGTGYAHKFLMDKLQIGIRLNYLKGIVNMEIDNSTEGFFRTHPDNYNLEVRLKKVQFNTSGLGLFSDSPEVRSHLLGLNNNGMSIDLGAKYSIENHSEVYFSIVDLGFLNWNYDVKNYRVENGNYTYSGVDIEDFEELETFFQSVEDSVQAIFEPEEISEKYKTNLNSGLSIGYSYHITNRHHLNFLYNSIFFRDDFRFGLSAGYGIDLNEVLAARIAYTYMNHQPFNIGLGLSSTFGFFNIYLISESFSNVFQPEYAKKADLLFGINLVF